MLRATSEAPACSWKCCPHSTQTTDLIYEDLTLPAADEAAGWD
jgi:hypothetical protein